MVDKVNGGEHLNVSPLSFLTTSQPSHGLPDVIPRVKLSQIDRADPYLPNETSSFTAGNLQATVCKDVQYIQVGQYFLALPLALRLRAPYAFLGQQLATYLKKHQNISIPM